MMPRNNDILRLESGQRVRVVASLSAGGEGLTYEALHLDSGQRGVLKVFNNKSPERVKRTKFLIDQRLGERCELFCAPTDWINDGFVAHFSPFAPGDPLETYLEQPGNSFFENLKLAIALSHAIAILNELGFAHGDIHLQNFMVNKTASGVEIVVFDFDNYRAPGAPPPLALGQEHTMAPEIRQAWMNGAPVAPDEYSDRYALTVVLHDTLLAKHPAAGFDGDPDAFTNCMLSGRWFHDPALGAESAGSAEGYPSAILNADLARLFRRGLGLERHERPSADEWRAALGRSFERIYVHQPCSGPLFIDAGQTCCPFCGRRFPAIKLAFPSLRKEIVCNNAAVPIGRGDLGSPKVSAHHAVVRRIGPETSLESFGRNGTYRWAATRWVPINKAIIEPGDRLQFADVEAYVQEAA